MMTASRRWVDLRARVCVHACAPARVGSHGPDDRAMCALFSQSSARSDWLLVTLSSLRNLAPPLLALLHLKVCFLISIFGQFEQSDRKCPVLSFISGV